MAFTDIERASLSTRRAHQGTRWAGPGQMCSGSGGASTKRDFPGTIGLIAAGMGIDWSGADRATEQNYSARNESWNARCVSRLHQATGLTLTGDL